MHGRNTSGWLYESKYEGVYEWVYEWVYESQYEWVYEGYGLYMRGMRGECHVYKGVRCTRDVRGVCVCEVCGRYRRDLFKGIILYLDKGTVRGTRGM